MSSKVRFDLSIPTSAATFVARCKLVAGRSPHSIMNIAKYFEAIAGGAYWGSCRVTSGAIQAQGKITVSTGGSSNGETMTLGNVTLTAKTSSADPTAGEFNISATASTQAASMVVAINTVSTLQGVVTAANVAGVITVTAVAPGTIGNGIQMAESLTNVAITNAMGNFTVGVDGTVTTVSNGL